MSSNRVARSAERVRGAPLGSSVGQGCWDPPQPRNKAPTSHVPVEPWVPRATCGCFTRQNHAAGCPHQYSSSVRSAAAPTHHHPHTLSPHSHSPEASGVRVSCPLPHTGHQPRWQPVPVPPARQPLCALPTPSQPRPHPARTSMAALTTCRAQAEVSAWHVVADGGGDGAHDDAQLVAPTGLHQHAPPRRPVGVGGSRPGPGEAGQGQRKGPLGPAPRHVCGGWAPSPPAPTLRAETRWAPPRSSAATVPRETGLQGGQEGGQLP